MAEITFEHREPGGRSHAAIFAVGVADRLVGTEVPLAYDFTGNGGQKVTTPMKGRITAAEVIDGGKAIRITMDVPEDFARSIGDKPNAVHLSGVPSKGPSA